MRNTELSKYIDKYSIKEPRAWFALSGIVLLGLVIYGFAIFYKGPVLDNAHYGVQLRFGKFWGLADKVPYRDPNLLAYATLDDAASLYIVAEPLQQDALCFSSASDKEIQRYADALGDQYRNPTVPSEAALPYGPITTDVVQIGGKPFVRLQYAGPNDTSQMIWEGNYNNTRYRIFAGCPANNKKLWTRIEQAVETLRINDT